MKKTILHIIILLSILIVSCKKETKTDEKTDVGKTEFKKEKVDTFSIEKTEPKKELKKQEPTDTLLIQKDTLLINYRKQYNPRIKGSLKGVEIFLLSKSEKDSLYLYAFGGIKKNERNYEKLVVFLVKSDSIISQLNCDFEYQKNDIRSCTSVKELRLKNIDETIDLLFAGEPGWSSSLYFFRKKDKLIKGLITSEYGELDNYSELLKIPTNNEANQIWIEKETGKTDIDNLGSYNYTNYFTTTDKYLLDNDSLILLNPKKENYYYVTARNGLRQRTKPFLKSDTLELLHYRTKINVLNKTDIEMELYDNGKMIKGHWVQIKYENKNRHQLSAYIFNGFLSKDKPPE